MAKPAPKAKPAAAKKPAKPAAKPAKAAKPAPAKKAAPAKKPAEKKPAGKKVYHVVKRADGMWEVKLTQGEKAIKLFKTKVEAEEYSDKMAENQGGVALVHASKGASKGKIQKR